MKIKIMIFGLVLLCLILNSYDSDPIKVDVIKASPQGRYSSVKIKITNTSGKHINSCQLTGILFKKDREIDAETHYVIKSTEGGLSPTDFVYFEYIFSVNRKEWDSIKFKIKSIDYK